MKLVLTNIGLNNNNFDFLKLKEYRKCLSSFAISIVESFDRESILFFAEFIREQFCVNEFPSNMLDHYMSITEAGIEIQRLALSNTNTFAKNANFNRNRLCLLIETLFMYENVDKKIKYSANNLYSCTFDNLFTPIMDQTIESYFKEYDLYFRAENIEESKVFNDDLQNYLNRKRLTPTMLYFDADNILKEVLGFTYSDIDYIVSNIKIHICMFNQIKDCLYGQHHVRIHKHEFKSLFQDIINIEHLSSVQQVSA